MFVDPVRSSVYGLLCAQLTLYRFFYVNECFVFQAIFYIMYFFFRFTHCFVCLSLQRCLNVYLCVCQVLACAPTLRSIFACRYSLCFDFLQYCEIMRFFFEFQSNGMAHINSVYYTLTNNNKTYEIIASRPIARIFMDGAIELLIQTDVYYIQCILCTLECNVLFFQFKNQIFCVFG